MTYRLTQAAEDQIDEILLKSAASFGIEAAGRYNRLLLAAMAAVAANPSLPGYRSIARLAGVRVYPARLQRMHTASAERVDRPRHLVIYRLGADGGVEILGVVHDRMLLERAARRAVRDAQ